MNYFIADTHFGHANVIKHDNRPFANVQEMDRTMIDLWNARVSPHDDVYILGDFAYRCSIENNRLILCHYPMAVWDGSHRDAIHLYGHVHKQGFDYTIFPQLKGLPNAYNACAVINNYMPCTLNEIIKNNKILSNQ